MTTIAYNHETKTLAVDSRMSCNGVIETDDCNKIIENEHGLWVMAGSVAEIDTFVSLKDGELMPDVESIIAGFLVTDGKVFYAYVGADRRPEMLLTEYSTAEGSGKSFALAAMDHGASADDAVEYTFKRDMYSGGTIRLIDVDTGEVSTR